MAWYLTYHELACTVIVRALDDYKREYPTLTPLELLKKIRLECYRFPERKGYPYSEWLRAIKTIKQRENMEANQ